MTENGATENGTRENEARLGARSRSGTETQRTKHPIPVQVDATRRRERLESIVRHVPGTSASDPMLPLLDRVMGDMVALRRAQGGVSINVTTTGGSEFKVVFDGGIFFKVYVDDRQTGRDPPYEVLDRLSLWADTQSVPVADFKVEKRHRGDAVMTYEEYVQSRA